MSDEQFETGPEPEPLDSVVDALSRFSVARPQIDRDRLMFLAGQASARGHESANRGTSPESGGVCLSQAAAAHWLWPATTAVLSATSLALGFVLLLRPVPQSERVNRSPETFVETTQQNLETSHATDIGLIARADPPSYLPTDNYLRMREIALRMGVDALGSPAVSS